MEKYYTAQETADILKVKIRTLYNYANGGQIKSNKIGNKYRFSESEIERFFKEGTEKNYTKKLKKYGKNNSGEKVENNI